MNDDELRAFLESATVGEPEPEDDLDDDAGTTNTRPVSEAAAPTAGQQGPSFDDIIGMRRGQVAPDTEPLVLPEPPTGREPDAGVAPLLLPPATPRSAAPPPTQPMSRADLPGGAADVPPTAPVAAVGHGGRPPVTSAPAAPPAPAAPRPAVPPAAPRPSAGVPGNPVPPVPPVPPAAATAPRVSATGAAAPGAAATAPLAPLFADTAPTSGADYERIAVTGGRDRGRALPWIIVAIVAVVAIAAALFIVGALRGGEDPAPAPAPTTSPTTSPSTPTTSPSPDVSPTPTGDRPPEVEVGSTMLLNVPQWGISADLSSRFGQANYVIDANDRLVLTSSLTNSLPESCAAMRQEWGIQRVDGTRYEVLKPAQRCSAAPELYDELWGLTAAMVESIRPLGGE